MRLTIILNSSSGLDPGGVNAEALRALFDSLGVETEIYRIDRGQAIADAVRTALARGASAVAAAGGDGTVGSVAAALVGTSIPLGVLPIGTLNHFARDAGIPLKIADAARVIAEGQITFIDVGEVNGRFFLNNSSIGFYPLMVSRREWLQQRGLPKPAATVVAVLLAVMRFPNLTVRVEAENAELIARTPFVFVGNNEYELSGLRAGRRTELQTGRMHVCVGRITTRAGLIRVALLALLGRMPAAPDLETLSARKVRIHAFRRRVRVALDGELLLLRSPLDYSIRPGALAIFAPQDGQ